MTILFFYVLCRYQTWSYKSHSHTNNIVFLMRCQIQNFPGDLKDSSILMNRCSSFLHEYEFCSHIYFFQFLFYIVDLRTVFVIRQYREFTINFYCWEKNVRAPSGNRECFKSFTIRVNRDASKYRGISSNPQQLYVRQTG